MVEQLLISREFRDQKNPVPKTLLIVDLETTGLHPEKSQVIEVAACLFSVEHREIIQSLCFLLPCEGENEAEAINHIKPELTQVSAPWRSSLHLLNEMIADADAMLAHNAAFDSQWFGIGKLPAVHIPWLCTMTDFDWGCRSAGGLRDLAANHGVPITKAHRALADVELVAGVLSAREDLDDLMASAVAPKITIIANVTYERRLEAKERGFRWNQPKRRWEKRITLAQYKSFDYPFTTKVATDD